MTKGRKKWLTVVLVALATAAATTGLISPELAADLAAEVSGVQPQ